jgi:outer membrane protein OmpA-like peptidoglycan-associated protein
LYNEDSPFLAEDGTLFFSSNGLPGYGGYDIYKTRYENGSWVAPENLGQPINSPGDDIYFALKPGSPDGYYSSSRSGGYGDMDIYQVHYMINTVKDCNKNDISVFVLNATPRNDDAMKYDISLEMPEAYSNKVRSYSWTLNNMPVDVMNPKFEHRFKTPGTYTVSVKTIVFCDTCTSLVARCNEKVIQVGDGVLAATTPEKTPESTTKTANENINKSGLLSEAELAELHWNTASLYFDYNNSSIKDNIQNVLEQNTTILKKNKNLSVIINGFADSRGTESYNKMLSAKRANIIKNYFVARGIPQSRIVVNAYGESQLVNKCSDNVECSEEEHQANRRAELKVMNKPFKSAITLK